jgi:hypothetical protein
VLIEHERGYPETDGRLGMVEQGQHGRRDTMSGVEIAVRVLDDSARVTRPSPVALEDGATVLDRCSDECCDDRRKPGVLVCRRDAGDAIRPATVCHTNRGVAGTGSVPYVPRCDSP